MSNKKRLIYADDALEVLCNYCGVEGCCPDGGCAEYRKISKLPTVDAVEVVHGQWEQQQGLYSCSECGKTCPYDVQADTIMYWTCNYCPNCGAKMDGERKDND